MPDPESTSSEGEMNWVDPDIMAMHDGDVSGLNFEHESKFHRFFTEEWPKAEYDDLRERWDPLITDEDAVGRLYGKTALWNVARLRAHRNGKDLI